MKKFLSLILIFVLVHSMSGIAFAQEANHVMYVEKEQVTLKNMTIDCDDNQLLFRSKDEKNVDTLSKMVENSPELENFLISLLEQGETLVAVGSSTIMLKEVPESIQEDAHLQPMTVGEVRNLRSTGADNIRGNLTLYTIATRADGGLHAYSCAEWSDVVRLNGSLRRAVERDCISITAEKEGLTIISEGFSANTQCGFNLPSNRYNKKDQSYTTVVYDFEEKADGATDYDVTFAVLSATYYGDNSGVYNCVSTYIHTWNTAEFEYNIGYKLFNVTITTSESAWHITSSALVS